MGAPLLLAVDPRSIQREGQPRPLKPAPIALRPRVRVTRTKNDDPSGLSWVSILLIEDNRLFRLGLSALLKKQKGLKLLASVEQPEHLPKLSPPEHPDVILLDLGLGGRGIVQVARGIRATYPESKLILMGLIPVQAEILGLVKEGVSGFILKDATVNEFVTSIRSVAAGQKVFPECLADSLFSRIVESAVRTEAVDIADVRMTTREREIVNLIALGMSNKEIAQRLSVATDTVKSHVHNILEKLSLRSRVQVAVRARGLDSTDK
jgi:DNA-binding NarL/FixJ family response regulator